MRVPGDLKEIQCYVWPVVPNPSPETKTQLQFFQLYCLSLKKSWQMFDQVWEKPVPD